MPRLRFILAVGLLNGMLAVMAGCAGAGTVYAVPFTRRDLPPHEPPVEVVQAAEAFWWKEGDAVHVVLRRRQPSLIGPVFAREFLLSLILQGMPAGHERLYQLNRDSLRVRTFDRGLQRRAASVMGVAVIASPRHGVLKGRLHAIVRQQQFTVLTGWAPALSRAPLVVMAGEFEAVHDPVCGRMIREQVEADGFSRSPEIWRIPPDTIHWLEPRPSATAPATQSTNPS